MDAAKELREVLTACGLTPFVKTTGGKGMHVVVAIKTSKNPVTWDDAKAFALAVSERIARAAPDRYVINMSKKQRGGKIFLDYLRNGRGATAVAPWSPRAREGAAIAVPLVWSQLRKGFDPSAFTIPGAAAVLKRPDPWKDLAASAAAVTNRRESPLPLREGVIVLFSGRASWAVWPGPLQAWQGHAWEAYPWRPGSSSKPPSDR